MQSLEQRVARLEVENRRLKVVVTFGALFASALGLAAAQPKPTRFKADIVEAGTIVADIIKANTVDSSKVLAGDLALYDDAGSTSLKVTNTGDGPTLAFTNEPQRPVVRMDIPRGSPARELVAPSPARPAADPARVAELEAKRQRLAQLMEERDRATREFTDQKQFLEQARRNHDAAVQARQDPSRVAVLQRIVQVRELSLADSEAALKAITDQIDALTAELGPDR